MHSLAAEPPALQPVSCPSALFGFSSLERPQLKALVSGARSDWQTVLSEWKLCLPYPTFSALLPSFSPSKGS